MHVSISSAPPSLAHTEVPQKATANTDLIPKLSYSQFKAVPLSPHPADTTTSSGLENSFKP